MAEKLSAPEISLGTYLVEYETTFHVVDIEWNPVNSMGTTTRVLTKNTALMCSETRGYPTPEQGRCIVEDAKGWNPRHFAVIEMRHLEAGYISPITR